VTGGGRPSDEQPLRSAGIERARAVIAATANDADDALSILTARELNPDIHIAAGVSQRQNVNKRKRAGADTVISPAAIGGRPPVESAMGQGDSARGPTTCSARSNQRPAPRSTTATSQSISCRRSNVGGEISRDAVERSPEEPIITRP